MTETTIHGTKSIAIKQSFGKGYTHTEISIRDKNDNLLHVLSLFGEEGELHDLTILGIQDYRTPQDGQSN